MTSAREAGQRRKVAARGLTMALHMCSPLIPRLLSSSPRSGRKCILLSESLFFCFPLMDRQWLRREEEGGGRKSEGKEGNVRIFFSLSLSRHESKITISMFFLVHLLCFWRNKASEDFFLRFFTIFSPFTDQLCHPVCQIIFTPSVAAAPYICTQDYLRHRT